MRRIENALTESQTLILFGKNFKWELRDGIIPSYDSLETQFTVGCC